MNMYQGFFGFDNAPFSIVPDHRVVYMSDSHREAVAQLLYSLKQSGGFAQLTGEVGTGKTTVCRYLLQHLPENVDVALLLNPRVNEHELLEVICDELHIKYPPHASLKQLVGELNKYLLAFHGVGRHTVLIIDEAQNLSREVLEQIRLLTNLETSTDKLLQIILIGQPELENMLGRHDLRQLSQRIIGRFKLHALNLKETREYINYRVQQAGSKRSLFTNPAIRQIHRASNGVPRLINVLCDSALMAAYSENRIKVDRKIVNRTIAEVIPKTEKTGIIAHLLRLALIPLAIALVVLAILVFDYQPVFNGLLANSDNVQIRVSDALPETNGSAKVADNNQSVSSDAGVQSQVRSLPEPSELKEDRTASSRFDLIYRLGVPFRTN